MIENIMKKKTILIVDDTPDNLALLGELLMPYYQVRVANSGPKALIAACAAPLPDLILLDIMMPGMDGYEVIKHLKENPVTSEIPVIFITALDSCEDETKGLELGARDYLSKPIRAPILLARVKGQLEIKAARDILRNQNNWLETEIQRRIGLYQKVQDISMRALASLAESRDNETGNHLLRTQNYLQVLAEDLAEDGIDMQPFSPPRSLISMQRQPRSTILVKWASRTMFCINRASIPPRSGKS
ncbi:response regulator [uncultured Desulfobacter sp.]|uniref:response regulator n=1 Tax=uncultured Desulfobacter sp. TaxID=240139 RepID=UPI002AAB1745|nr:response regulator [uncultured Desulfobacter sp.]